MPRTRLVPGTKRSITAPLETSYLGRAGTKVLSLPSPPNSWERDPCLLCLEERSKWPETKVISKCAARTRGPETEAERLAAQRSGRGERGP